MCGFGSPWVMVLILGYMLRITWEAFVLRLHPRPGESASSKMGCRLVAFSAPSDSDVYPGWRTGAIELWFSSHWLHIRNTWGDFKKIKMPGPHPRTNESESLKKESDNFIISKLLQMIWYTTSIKNHCYRQSSEWEKSRFEPISGSLALQAMYACGVMSYFWEAVWGDGNSNGLKRSQGTWRQDSGLGLLL